MRAQTAARLMPSWWESSVPATPPLPAARRAVRILVSMVTRQASSKSRRDVHGAGGMGERADGNEIHAGFGDGADGGEIHAAAGFGLRAALRLLHGEAQAESRVMLSSRIMSAPAATACSTCSSVSASTSTFSLGYWARARETAAAMALGYSLRKAARWLSLMRTMS